MFSNNFPPIPVFCDDNHPKSPQNISKTAEKLLTRLQRQKESRYQLLSHRRFNQSTEWEDDGHDNGYQSDESSDSRNSAINLDKISHLDVLKALLYCEPLPESETILNTAVSASLSQLDSNHSDFDIIGQMVANFFSSVILNKMSTFIGSKESVAKQQLSDELINNLIDSQMVPKLIEILVSGNEVLVERSLQLLLWILENNNSSSTALLTHILKSGFVDVMTERTDRLRWKTFKAHSWDLKINRRQRMSENNFSFETKVLLQQFARAVCRLVAIDMEDSLREALLSKVTPLLNRFFVCPDPRVISSAIDSLRMFALRGNPNIYPVIVQSFGRYLLSITDKTEESVIFATLQLFKTLMANCPQLFVYQDFGSNLISYMEKAIQQKRNNEMSNHKKKENNDEEIIAIISSIGLWIADNTETNRQLTNRLIHLSLVVFNGDNQYNRRIAIEAIESILIKYSFDSFVSLLTVFDIRGLILRLLVCNKGQQIGLNICDKIVNILSKSFDVKPEEVEKVKHLLFGKSSDIYYCLEKLSFKTCNDFVSNRAHQLLKQIDCKFSDEDIKLLPGINQNDFVFGPNF